MNEVSKTRLFVAIPLPDFVKERLTALQADLPHLRWTQAENLHLTLKFIGEVDEDFKDRIQTQLEAIQVKPFLLAVSGVGVFPERGNPAVLWAGFGSAHPHLFQLHKQIDDALFSIGIEPDRRVYRPHITLSRCKGVSRESLRPFLRKQADLETAPFRVEHFELVSSELLSRGPVYQRLGSYALRYNNR